MSEVRINPERVRRAMKLDGMPLLTRELAEIIQVLESHAVFLAENAELKKERDDYGEKMKYLYARTEQLKEECVSVETRLTDAITALEQCEKLFKEMLEDPELDFQGVEHHYELPIAGLVVKIQTLLKLKGGG